MKKKLVMVMISTMQVASLMACGSKKNESERANIKTEQFANNTDTKDAKKTEEKELSYDTIKDYPETKVIQKQTLIFRRDASAGSATSLMRNLNSICIDELGLHFRTCTRSGVCPAVYLYITGEAIIYKREKKWDFLTH